MRGRWKPLFLGTLVIALALCLRLPGLSWGLPNETHLWPYHPDEALALIALGRMNPRSFDFNPRTAAGHHAYVYFTGASLAVGHAVGWVHLDRDRNYYRSHPEQLAKIYRLLRVTGIAWDLLGILLVGLLGRLVAGAEVGWWAAVLAAVNPFRVFIAHIATYYVPVMAITTLAAWAILSERPKIAGLAIGIGTGFVYIGGIPVGLALLRWWRSPRVLLTTAVISMVAFLCSSPYFIWDAAATLRGFHRIADHYIRPVESDAASTASLWHTLMGTLPLSFLLLAVAGFVTLLIALRTRDVRPGVLNPAPARDFVLYSLLVLAVLVVLSPRLARHCAFFYPILEVLSAASVIGPVGKLWMRSALVAVACVLAIQSAAHVVAFRSCDPRDQALAWFETHVPKGTAVAGVNWYFVPQIRMEDYVVTMLWGELEEKIDVTPHKYLMLSNCDADLARWDRDPRYFRAATFKADLPAWAEGPLSGVPMDLRYHMPEIVIFQRREP